MEISKIIENVEELQTEYNRLPKGKARHVCIVESEKWLKQALANCCVAVGNVEKERVAFIFGTSAECDRFCRDNIGYSFSALRFADFAERICGGGLNLNKFGFNRKQNTLTYTL